MQRHFAKLIRRRAAGDREHLDQRQADQPADVGRRNRGSQADLLQGAQDQADEQVLAVGKRAVEVEDQQVETGDELGGTLDLYVGQR